MPVPKLTPAEMKAFLEEAKAMYKAKFTDAEMKDLRAIFPDGVCDYSKPGVNQVPTAKTWQFY